MPKIHPSRIPEPASPGAAFPALGRAFLALAGLSLAAHATSFNVNTTNMNLVNDGNCGLREAVLAINAQSAMYGCPAGNGSTDAIYLPQGTYTSPAGMTLSRNAHIVCNGPGACNIDAGNFSGALFQLDANTNPSVYMYRLNLRQPSANAQSVTGIGAEGGTLNIDNVSITGFKLNGLVVTRGTSHYAGYCTISNNAVMGVFIAEDAALTLNHSTLNANTQNGIVLGPDGTVNLAYSTITNHGQAGIAMSQDADVIDNGSTIAGNTGAGIDAGYGSLDLSRTVIRGNLDGGIKLYGGYAELEYCAIEYNRTSGNGGGLSVLTPSNISVKSSSITNNKASGNGGGLYMTGGGNFYNVTVSNDTATRGGGMYHNPGGSGGGAYIEMYFSTIASNRATNSGGGVYPIAGSSPFRTIRCIVAQNSAPTNPDVSGFINSYYTMYSNVAGFTGVHNNDYHPYNPLLGPLMDNAGPNRIKTHALLKGSPAIDLSSPQTSIAPEDGRGFPRLATVNWDLGAYEAGPLEHEVLSVVAQNAWPHYVAANSGYSNGKGMWLNATAANHYVVYAVAVPEIGTYDVKVRVRKGPDRGQVQMASSPSTTTFTNIGSPFDLYSASAAFSEITVGTFQFTSVGTKHFRFLVTGKHASSTGYNLYLDYVKLTKQ